MIHVLFLRWRFVFCSLLKTNNNNKKPASQHHGQHYPPRTTEEKERLFRTMRRDHKHCRHVPAWQTFNDSIITVNTQQEDPEFIRKEQPCPVLSCLSLCSMPTVVIFEDIMAVAGVKDTKVYPIR